MKKLKILPFIIVLTVISCHPLGGFVNEVIIEAYSPERSIKVIMFERFAGATADNSVQILITDPDYELDNTDGGNVFGADKIDAYNLSEAFSVNWISNDSIVIIHPDSIRIFKAEDYYETEFREVVIVYNPK